MSDELAALKKRLSKIERHLFSPQAKQRALIRYVHRLAEAMILEDLLENQLRATGDPDRASRDLLDFYENVTDGVTFGERDPAMSDLASQEFRDHLVRTILRARSAALDEPSDPNAYLKSWRSPEFDDE